MVKGYLKIINKPYIGTKKQLNKDMLKLNLVWAYAMMMEMESHKTTNNLFTGIRRLPNKNMLKHSTI